MAQAVQALPQAARNEGFTLSVAREPLDLDDQKGFFDTHIGPWASHFFADLEGARGSRLYASVGTIGRAFMEIEASAFRMLDN